MIERGKWKEPEKKPFVPLDENGNRIENLDLRPLAKQKQVMAHAKVHAPDVPASFNTGSSLADRIRVVSAEEYDRYRNR